MKLQVHADKKQNHTSLVISVGDVLYFDCRGTWKDATISCDANGWTGASVLPFAAWIYDNDFLNNQKVCPGFPYMHLMGKVGKQIFPIGAGKKQIVVQDTGELILFANDISWLYWNNSGSVFVGIE